MSEEVQNDQQQNGEVSGYQDPLAAQNGEKPAKKSGGAAAVVSMVAAIVVVRLFGVLGGLICFAGFWAVYAVAKSKLPLAARIVLCVFLTLVFLALMVVFILVAATLTD